MLNIFLFSYLAFQKIFFVKIVFDFFLLVSECDPDSEYTCNDGTCIPSADRCNRIDDCQEGEDEEQCGKWKLFCHPLSPV